MISFVTIIILYSAHFINSEIFLLLPSLQLQLLFRVAIMARQIEIFESRGKSVSGLIIVFEEQQEIFSVYTGR